MSLWTENIDHYILQEPPVFDAEGAAKAGEIGCFNCKCNRAEASNGEVFCQFGKTEFGWAVVNPEDLDWRDIVGCWECE